MQGFDDVRLPENVEQGAVGGPSWNTGVVTMANGEEQRTQNWTVPRHTYQITYDTSDTDWQPVRDFFNARRGRARGFRFKDWTDFVVKAQPVSGTVPTQLARVYVDAIGETFTRAVTRVVPGSLVISDISGALHDGNNVPYTSMFTESFGGLTPKPGTVEPAGGLYAAFEFDVPVRFDTDQLAITADTSQAASVGTLNLIELPETTAKLVGAV